LCGIISGDRGIVGSGKVVDSGDRSGNDTLGGDNFSDDCGVV